MRIFLLMMVAFVAITALASGLLMMYQPDGSTLGLSPDMLGGTPFSTYFIPGLLLALIVEGTHLVALFLIMARSQKLYRLTFACGIILVAWIIGQMLVIDSYNWLQGAYLAIGVLTSLISYQLMGKAAF